jgi:hypothetical protein
LTLELSFETKDKKFLSKFKLKSKHHFDSHKELDLFVNDLLAIDSQFKLNHPGEFELLKSFDRAFWLRHYNDTKLKQHKPHYVQSEEDEDEFELDCPFGDPQETYSINFTK